ncbi:MAG: GPR endopeptidase [Firmicutes bacterium]|nr:GPR endopeptidase [Bacillota bacterium]
MKKKNYIIRTDLALHNTKLRFINSYKIDGIEIKEFINNSYNFTDIVFENIENTYNKKLLIKVLVKELKKYLKKYNLNKKCSVLVVGLGNVKITSDSLGPLTLNNVIATSHLEYFNINNNYRKIYKYTPGIMKDTGLMPFQSIKALINEIKPDFLIVVDSLISDNIKYLNKVVQITDIGITPGSGVSNYQEEISINTLNIPIIVVGVPTAIEALTIVKDVLNIKEKKIYFNEGYDFIFSTKDTDLIIDDLSKIIGEVINKSLNNFKKI